MPVCLTLPSNDSTEKIFLSLHVLDSLSVCDKRICIPENNLNCGISWAKKRKYISAMYAGEKLNTIFTSTNFRSVK